MCVALVCSLLLCRLGGKLKTLDVVGMGGDAGGFCTVYKLLCVGMLFADKYLGHRLAVVSRRYQEGPNRWPESFRPQR